MLLPDPIYLGLPEKFTHWRPGQDRAVLAATDSPRRFVAQAAPTGFGKTVTYFAQALLSGARTAFLTASKGLQAQLLEDFTECGLLDIRGQGNYICRALQPGGEHYSSSEPSDRCDAGPCHMGVFCSRRFRGCDYFDAVGMASRAQLAVTNYSYWIAQHRYSEGLGKFDLLVLDEAHDAAEELAASMEVEIFDFDVTTLSGRSMPIGQRDQAHWQAWATILAGELQDRVDVLGEYIRDGGASRADYRERFAASGLLRKVSVVAEMEGEWVIERQLRSAKFAPVWPGPYAERYLFLDIPKVVLVSATLRPKSLALLGIPPGEFEFLEYPSSFPPARRPVVHVPSVRLQHNWSDIEQKTWVSRIDQIIDRRLDRKGIIHTGSYNRRDLILTHSSHRSIMLFNDPKNTRSTVEKFRQLPPPVVLVSPSLTTGWDLPQEDCEYAIIGKIPFPDTTSAITKARTQQDVDYGPYIAMQQIVQASGRGMRSAEDQCEVFILDDHWKWFWPKYKHFAPGWFKETVRRSVTVPNPLPKLKEKLNA